MTPKELKTGFDPWQFWRAWYAEASAACGKAAGRFVLATVGADGRPSARNVSLHPGPDGELRFFTNLGSRKAQELGHCPWAATVFYWAPLGRQVRIEGTVDTIPSEDADRHFASRPLEHQWAAVLSPQSQPIASITELTERHRQKRFSSDLPARPRHWGGFQLVPDRFEFRDKSECRLNQRHYFQLLNSVWHYTELAP